MLLWAFSPNLKGDLELLWRRKDYRLWTSRLRLTSREKANTGKRDKPQLPGILSCFGDLLLTVSVTDRVESDTFQKLSVGDIVEFLNGVCETGYYWLTSIFGCCNVHLKMQF